MRKTLGPEAFVSLSLSLPQPTMTDLSATAHFRPESQLASP